MRCTRRTALAGLGAVSVAGPVSAASAQGPSRLQQELASLRRSSGTPGMALAWQPIGQPVQEIVDGLRSAGEGVTPVQPLDRWHLGSLSKSMTATLAAILVEAGRIDWATTIADALPESGRSSYGGMTLLHLLSHRAGLPHELPQPMMNSFPRDPVSDPLTDRLRFALEALAQPPATAPGGRFFYSNMGYVVAAAMLEARSGKAWEVLIKDAVFAPLGLSSAGFGPPVANTEPPDGPLGHRILGNGQRVALSLDNPVALNPAGRVHMALADLITYLAVHRDKSPALLSRKSWRMLHNTHFGGDYALGWVVLPGGLLWHNGSNGLWNAEALIGTRTVAAFAANDAATKSGQPSSLIRAALTS